jgi:hypothetical protein
LAFFLAGNPEDGEVCEFFAGSSTRGRGFTIEKKYCSQYGELGRSKDLPLLFDGSITANIYN